MALLQIPRQVQRGPDGEEPLQPRDLLLLLVGLREDPQGGRERQRQGEASRTKDEDFRGICQVAEDDRVAHREPNGQQQHEGQQQRRQQA